MIDVAAANALLREALSVQGVTSDPRPLDPDRPPAQAQLFSDGRTLYKVYAPDALTRATAQAKAQANVAQSGLAPPILFQQNTILAMPHLGGPDLATLWQKADASVAVEAGTWLRAYHALTLRRFPFRPAGHVKWLARLLDQADSGERHIPDQAAFRQAANRTREYAEAARKQKATRAVTHRDMTLSNLVRDETRVLGIDFENMREDEPLRDLFTLALDIATIGNVSSLASLRAAYADRHTAPPVRLFLQRCFCHWVWANTPTAPSRRQTRRLDFARGLLDSDVLIL
ncbi:aminoglycoside phosphotransferase [Sagittula marina]|uniref:Aminoglycoside phosphotransferase n=1 Tax=Sagittula marina TaxID=943940 RepID=A0A7W6DQ95_9RHOB|nr:aminoglycoside phosphotransferase [Sagittula marina]